MKINLITGSMYGKGKTKSYALPEKRKECVKERENLKQNNYDNINTSIKSNPDARVSFKGSSMTVLDKAIHYGARFAENNHVAADAFFVLPILCGLKPAIKLVMANKAKNEEEKEKFQYQAAKSAASGLVGFAVSFFIGVVITEGMRRACDLKTFKIPPKIEQNAKAAVNQGIELLNKIKPKLKPNSQPVEQIDKLVAGSIMHLSVFNNKSGKLDKKLVNNFVSNIEQTEHGAGKVIRTAIKEQQILDSYKDAAKNTGKKLFQPGLMPLRAKITTASIPAFLGWLGLKKPKKNKKNTQPSQNTIQNNVYKNTCKDEKAQILFSPFLEEKK